MRPTPHPFLYPVLRKGTAAILLLCMLELMNIRKPTVFSNILHPLCNVFSVWSGFPISFLKDTCIPRVAVHSDLQTPYHMSTAVFSASVLEA